nr:hypothetical protein [Tanacetum cinerariifolium]GFA30742.1 hypothetical protein [Tanacetum cinerariifolium]
MPRECLKIVESKSKVRQTRAKAVVAKLSTSSSTSAISSGVAELKDMVRALLLDKKNQSSVLVSFPAPVKAVEPNCVTCDGTHSYQNCLATNGNIYRDNIQEYESQAAAANYNQRNTGLRPQMVANQIRPPGFKLDTEEPISKNAITGIGLAYAFIRRSLGESILAIGEDFATSDAILSLKYCCKLVGLANLASQVGWGSGQEGFLGKLLSGDGGVQFVELAETTPKGYKLLHQSSMANTTFPSWQKQSLEFIFPFFALSALVVFFVYYNFKDLAFLIL